LTPSGREAKAGFGCCHFGSTIGEVSVFRRHGLILISCLVVPGCASTEELESQAPKQAFNTSEKIATIRDCIVLPNRNYIQALPKGDGWLVTSIGAEVSNFAVDLTPTPQGTHVEVRRVVGPLNVVWDRDVEPCIDKLPRN